MTPLCEWVSTFVLLVVLAVPFSAFCAWLESGEKWLCPFCWVRWMLLCVGALFFLTLGAMGMEWLLGVIRGYLCVS